MKTIYTIGTNGSTPTVLLSVLEKHNISHLYDIRCHPDTLFARCTGKILDNLLSKVKTIEYQRVPDLAPSKKLIKEAKGSGWKPAKYINEIGESGLKMAWDLINKYDVPCFLCSEPLHELNNCHRKTLIDTLVKSSKGAFKVEHLDGREFFKESLDKCQLHKGKRYDLHDIFKKVNEEYFKGRYREEHIYFAWEEMPSQMRRYRILGSFRYPCLIILNPVLDRKDIPQPVTEAVVYHEMLHLQRAHEGLPAGHTVDFYLEEALFREYARMFRFDFTEVWESFRKGGV